MKNFDAYQPTNWRRIFYAMKRILSLFLVVCLFACSRKDTELIDGITAPKHVVDYEMDVDEIEHANVKRLYTDLNGTTLWKDSLCVQDALSFLRKGSGYGLPAHLYSTDSLQKAYQNRYDWSKDEAIAFELELSKQLLTFFNDVHHGHFQPNQLYADWDLYPPKLQWTRTHSEWFNARHFDSLARKLEPKHPQYHALKANLSKYDTWPDNPSVAYPEKLKLTPDTISPYVVNVRKQLQYWKYTLENDSSQVYDAALVKQIKAFQTKEGLNPDGVIGKGTLAALNRSKHHLKAEIAANMERWRWYPTLDTAYVLINIPDYQLLVFAENEVKFQRKVIVGKAERKTPVLVSTLSDIVLNPTWTLPPTIIAEDLAKHHKKDSSYFTKKNIQILNYKREPVSPLNWNPEKPNNYIYVQAPGDDNALGRIKFNFKNRFLVYLHDTNTRSYYKREARALSSGCVRVQDPLPIAEFLLDNPKVYPLDSLVAYTQPDRFTTTTVRVTKRLPLYIFYNTMWVNEKGQLIRRPDIYRWNSPLTKRLID